MKGPLHKQQTRMPSDLKDAVFWTCRYQIKLRFATAPVSCFGAIATNSWYDSYACSPSDAAFGIFPHESLIASN